MKELISQKISRLISILQRNDFLEAAILIEELKLEAGPTTQNLIKALCAKYAFEPKNQHPMEDAVPKQEINLSASNSAKLLSQFDSIHPRPGISIVSCCMNRNDNLKKSLRSWIQLPIDEIIIVDWSSNTPVAETISDVDDPRVRIVRVHHEKNWILTYGFNVGLRIASYEKIFKLDADIEVTPDFLKLNNFSENEFIRGSWRCAMTSGKEDQIYVNGSFGCYKRHLQKIGFYNEFIRTYGWDDSDLYLRLATDAGLGTKFLHADSIVHLEQNEASRLAAQNVSKNKFGDHFDPTQYQNMRNRYQTALMDDWNKRLLSEFKIINSDQRILDCHRVSKDIPIPDYIIIDAERYAVLRLTSWLPNEGYLYSLLKADIRLSHLINDHYHCGVPFHITKSIVQNTNNPSFLTNNFLHGNLYDYLNTKTENSFFISNTPKSLAAQIGDRNFWLISNTCDSQELLTNPPIYNTESSPKRVCITSVYDENNPLRLEDYLFCISNNALHFDALVLIYEKSSGVLFHEIRARLAQTDLWNKIIFIHYKHRPTFDFLFDLADALFPECIIHLSNADITVDESIREINEKNISDSFFTISRHETDAKTKKSTGLVMTNLGTPNTFSADMWVYLAPRKFRFKADFLIGTFHCDSYLNYYIAKSGYKLFNPCLDISLYHIHDPVFNSSEEKAIKQKEEIDCRLQSETAFNGGDMPLRGSRWGMLATYSSVTTKTLPVPWHDSIIKIEFHENHLIEALIFVLLAIQSCKKSDHPTSVWIMLPNTNTEIYNKISEFVNHVDYPHVYIGVTGNTAVPSNYKPSSKPDLKEIFNPLTGATEFVILHEPNTIGTYTTVGNDLKTYNALKSIQPNYLHLLKSIFSPTNHFIPFCSDLDELLGQIDQICTSTKAPSICFVTSVFKGAEFMLGYLQNIAACAAEVNGHVIIIDANSPQNEFQIFTKFIAENPAYARYFIYKKLDNDPGLYNCWKLAIEMSTAEYISNANLDDRRSPFQAKALVRALSAKPEYAGAASAIRATRSRNTGWYQQTDNDYWFNRGYNHKISFDSLYLKEANGFVKSRNIMHCMPVWRKSLHQKYGFFNEEKYGTSADWAFWLECTKHHESFLLMPSVLSQYYVNEQSHNRVNDPNGIKENRIISDYLGAHQTEFYQQ